MYYLWVWAALIVFVHSPTPFCLATRGQFSIRLHFQPTRMTVRTARFVRFLAATLRSIARHERSYCHCCGERMQCRDNWYKEEQKLRRQALSLASYEMATSEDAAIAVLRGEV